MSGPYLQSSCRDCTFADYDGDTQVGCSIGHLDKLHERGGTVTQIRDADKAYFAVDRYCTMNQHREDCGVETREETYARRRKQVGLKLGFIIYVPASATVEDLSRTLGGVAVQVVPPSLVAVLLPGAGVTPGEARVALLRSGLACPFHIETLEDFDEEDLVGYGYEGGDRGKAIDLAVRQVDPKRILYYWPIDAGTVPAPIALELLDRAVHDECLSVPAVAWEGGYLAQIRLHTHDDVRGNYGRPFIAKLPDIAEDWKINVCSWEDLA